MKNINFTSKFKLGNYFSLFLFLTSVLFIIFKGLNYGIDFKGGTLIELKTDESIKIKEIRSTLRSMNLGDVNVKEFGEKNIYLIKIELDASETNKKTTEIKE